jgi:diguanylate cyclase (GGDEF)-like protein
MTELLHQLGDLTAVRDRDALDVALVRAIHDLLQPQSSAIYRIVGESGNERWLTSAKLQDTQVIPTGDSAWARLDALPLASMHPLRQQAAASQQVQKSPCAPCLTVFPLAGNATAVGVLELGSTVPLSTENMRLVNGVLRLYLNFQSLLDYGERDALTELLNRKTFDDAFLKATTEQRLNQASTQDERRDTHASGTYWLAMIDIDHFKRVNDNYGHLIGDEVLLLLARLMRTCFRFHDQLYRFGGEEFVVLMRCHNEAEATDALERLRTATEQYLFPQVGRITISIGFSEVIVGDTPSGAFERADKAVYYAKEHGRNQVCSFAALIATGELLSQAANIGDMELF